MTAQRRKELDQRLIEHEVRLSERREASEQYTARLKALWNELGQRCSFQLLCGYAAAHFGDERTAKHLHTICEAHHHSGARATDLLATWLLSNRISQFHTEQ